MKCRIRWIDKLGRPTPDSNDAVALAQCKSWGLRDTGDAAELSEPIPICAAHVDRFTHWGRTYTSFPHMGDKHRVYTLWTLHPLPKEGE